MTEDTFKSIVHTVMKKKGAQLKGSGESKLNALARDYSSGKTDIAQAIGILKSIYSSYFEIDRNDYDEIEKRLERY